MENVSDTYVPSFRNYVAKLKVEEFFTDPVRKLLNDPLFLEAMSKKKKEAWSAFKKVVPTFLKMTTKLLLCNPCWQSIKLKDLR